MSDVYVVRNDSGGELELVDFGVALPDTVVYETGDFNKAILSASLQAQIQADDLVRVVSGLDVPKANALFHKILFTANRVADQSHSFLTWQDELVIAIAGASDGKLRASFQAEYENDTKDKLTELRLTFDGVPCMSCEATVFSDKDKTNSKSFSGFWDYLFTGAGDLKLQSQTAGGSITTRNVILTVEVI